MMDKEKNEKNVNDENNWKFMTKVKRENDDEK